MSQSKIKSTVAIFAHPDDESFGPAGTIAKIAKIGNVHLICATEGGAGGNRQLAKIRREELKKAANILKIKSLDILKFQDGKLSNSIYHELAAKIQKLIKLYKPQTLITFEPRGVSGHIDHITVSLVTTFVFYKLSFVKKLMYYCISKEERNLIADYFIYFPPGYSKNEIDEVIDISKYYEIKKKAMLVHKSQSKDAKQLIKINEILPKEEYFKVIDKN